MQARIKSEGVLWKDLNKFIVREAIPPNTDNPWNLAYSLVPKLLTAVFGPQDTGWHTYRDAESKTRVKGDLKSE